VQSTKREIVGEEDIASGRQRAFVSFGNLYNRVIPDWKYIRGPISYEKFLISVFLSLSEIRIGIPNSVYIPFVEDVLLPLSHDLSHKGPARPPVVIDSAFIERMTRYVNQDRSELLELPLQTKYLIYSFVFPEPIPHEILWSGIYRKIDYLIMTGHYNDPYYLYKYYKTLPTEGEDAIRWGDALDEDIWCNYYLNSLLEFKSHIERENSSIYITDELIEKERYINELKKIEVKIDEIKNLMINFEEMR
jgi:hypothetical protein